MQSFDFILLIRFLMGIYPFCKAAMFGSAKLDEFLRSKYSAPLAQLVEQLTLNQWVQGSSPWRCTK